MARTYLSKVARRHHFPWQSIGRSGPGGSPKPAIASRSPLAEADQRLHLDLASKTTTPPWLGSSGLDTPDEAWPDSEGAGARDDSTPSSTRLEAPPIEPNEAEPPPIRPLSTNRATPPSRTGGKAKAATSPDGRADPRDAPANARREVSSAPSGPRPRTEAGSPGAQTPLHREGFAPSKERAAQSTEALSEKPRLTITRSSLAAVRQHAATPVPSDAKEIDAISAALAAAERWVAAPKVSHSSEAPRTPTHGQGPSSAEGSQAPNTKAQTVPRAEARPPEWPVATAQPLTRLEIGNIDVEVVAPAKIPSQPSVRPAPRREASTATSAFRPPPFGWRQR